MNKKAFGKLSAIVAVAIFALVSFAVVTMDDESSYDSEAAANELKIKVEGGKVILLTLSSL